MENLLTELQIALGDMQAGRLVFLTLISLSVATLLMGVYTFATGMTDPVRRRLKQISDIESRTAPVGVDMFQALRPIQAYILPKDNWERSRVQARLVQAGWRADSALWVFYGLKVILAAGLPIVVLSVCALVVEKMSFQLWLFAFSGSAWLGMMLPNRILTGLIQRRQQRIRLAIPDALDLLVVSLEAGLGLRSAIQRLSDDLYISHPELANELELVNAAMRAGVPSDKALQDMGMRIRLKEVDGLISTLSDSIRYGSSIADTLRTFSEDFRDRRIQSAEEQAAKIGTKMIFPLILFLLPAFFLVAVGPAIMQLIESFSQF
ncbi:type II secretion system F family protein [Endozoicomonas sp. GU-1]|uniref:type II secretion system F family protein n=1 Tax=Endozoicomonas sp. GU-1 TaxID=3009078 RepID=UPI0022B4EA18|nr:type II secretion system F family protein [Endozoicomonas sp. GU-1]WBA79855.1 type II secretion system F family protein [Endozoicomonas sp. GU-1]WBA87430.1 type II secretion system F family protein [Endozoicomonas sp. GU-1]